MSRPHVSARLVGRAVSWATLGQIVSQLTWLVSLVILATLVPPRAFGTVSVTLIAVNVAQLLIGSGTRGSLVAAKTLGTAQLRYALLVTAGGAAAVGAIVALLAGPIAHLLSPAADPQVLRALIASLTIYAASIVPMAMLQRHLRFRKRSMVLVISSLVGSLAAVAAGALGAGVWALALRQIVYSVLVSVIAWTTARDLLPPLRQLVGKLGGYERARRTQAVWFFMLSLANLAALNVDYIVVGHIVSPTQLGLYALAFTLGFAPLTQFSWQLGTVLFPSIAATDGSDAVGERTLRALRMATLLLVPLIAVVAALAPWLIPNLLGHRWAGMVFPFQVLFAVGVGHGLINVIGEALSGTGNVPTHTRLHVCWALAMPLALIPLVHADGINGAAIAHAIVLLPIAAAYFMIGLRQLHIRARRIGRVASEIAALAAGQAIITLVVARGLATFQAPDTAVTATVSGGLGLAAALIALALVPSSPLREAASLARAVTGRSAG
jgi:O-antigen/teichoic acid export membrane protein